MEGYRAYAFIIVTALGWFGIGEIITEDKVADLINLSVQFVGIVGTAYFNYKNHKQIDTLKGLAGIK